MVSAEFSTAMELDGLVIALGLASVDDVFDVAAADPNVAWELAEILDQDEPAWGSPTLAFRVHARHFGDRLPHHPRTFTEIDPNYKPSKWR